jgi:hypothetical protein
MNLNANDIIEQIVRLPGQFHSLGNVSMVSLLEATGYFVLHDQISEADIRAALVRCPECVQQWFQYSEDKRTSGWYLTHNDEGCYEIGYVTQRGDCQQRVVYQERVDACAAFVKCEIEEIRLGFLTNGRRARGNRKRR